MSTRQPVLYLMIGGIAAGKSTLATVIENGSTDVDPHMYVDIEHICVDDIREELSGDAADQSVNAEAWRIAYQRMDEAMAKQEDVIFDAAYMVKYKTRRDMNARAKRHGYRVIYIILSTSLEDSLTANAQRDRKVPEDVVRRYHNDLFREFPFLTTDKV